MPDKTCAMPNSVGHKCPAYCVSQESALSGCLPPAKPGSLKTSVATRLKPQNRPNVSIRAVCLAGCGGAVCVLFQVQLAGQLVEFLLDVGFELLNLAFEFVGFLFFPRLVRLARQLGLGFHRGGQLLLHGGGVPAGNGGLEAAEELVERGFAVFLRQQNHGGAAVVELLRGDFQQAGLVQGFGRARVVADNGADGAALLQHLPSPLQGIRPGSLLNQRPDLRARAAEIQARSAQLASAKADLLPRFDIQFLWQTGRIELNSDLAPFNRARSGNGGLFSIGVQFPLFTAGRIRANIQAADTRLQTALLQYDQTLLQALADVDNAYQAQHALNTQQQELQQAERTAQQQVRNDRQLFRYGRKTLDTALQSQLSAHGFSQNLLDNQLAVGLNLLNLYKAIDSGWQEEGTQPTATEAAAK